MKIYLSGSIRGGREFQDIYQIIFLHLKKNGHIVLDEHVASLNVFEIENKLTNNQIYTQDIKWLHESDLIIAEISIPSLGVGYEIAYSLHVLKKPVLGVYNNKRAISVMILGNTSEFLHLYPYNGINQLLNYIDNFLKNFSSN